MKTKSKSKTRKPEQIIAANFARTLGISRQNLYYHMKNPMAPPLGDYYAWRNFLAAFGRIHFSQENQLMFQPRHVDELRFFCEVGRSGAPNAPCGPSITPSCEKDSFLRRRAPVQV